MGILGKGPSLNHPEDLEVTERTSRKRIGEKLAIKKIAKYLLRAHTLRRW